MCSFAITNYAASSVSTWLDPTDTVLTPPQKSWLRGMRLTIAPCDHGCRAMSFRPKLSKLHPTQFGWSWRTTMPSKPRSSSRFSLADTDGQRFQSSGIGARWPQLWQQGYRDDWTSWLTS